MNSNINENEKKGFLTTIEYAKKVGMTSGGVLYNIKKGVIKGAKIYTSENGSKQWLIPDSKESFIQKKRRAPYMTKAMRNALLSPEEEEVDDILLSELDNYVPEGKIPFRKMILSVKMMIERKPIDVIEYKTGMKKSGITKLIKELKIARKKEPKKYPSMMSYLKAERPYQHSKRNMLDKGSKK